MYIKFLKEIHQIEKENEMGKRKGGLSGFLSFFYPYTLDNENAFMLMFLSEISRKRERKKWCKFTLELFPRMSAVYTEAAHLLLLQLCSVPSETW